MSPALRRSALVTATLLSAGLVGCDKKGPECQAMVGVINPASDAMMRAASSKGGTLAEQAGEMRKMATVTKNAADAMSKLSVTVPELKKVQSDYQALYTAASTDSTSLAAALDEIGAAEKEMDRVGGALKTAIDAWGEACSSDKNKPEADGCAAFAAAMQALPKDPTDKAGVDRALAAMDKVSWKGDALRDASKKVRDAYAASTRQIAAMQAIGARAEATEKNFKAIETKEQALIDGFNKFCKQ